MSATLVNYGYSKPLTAYLLLFQKVISKMDPNTKTTKNVHEGMQVILKRAHSGVANIVVDSDERGWRCKIAFEEMKATDINCFATAT